MRWTKTKESARSVGQAVFWALLLRAFVVQAYQIPSESMVPTLQVGDHIFVDKVTYRLRQPRLGEVIVFTDPRDPDRNLIKRVGALAGDTVEVRGQTVTVPPGNLYMLGDNRENSSDSRDWGFVPVGLVQGRAMFVWWSAPHPGRIGHIIR
jgi:signal peptidase I